MYQTWGTEVPGNSRPLYLKQNVQTIRKYTAVWKKILQYIWRTEAIAERHRCRLTHVQKQALVKLRYAARDKSRTVRGSVVDASFAFWVAMFDQELPDNKYESGLLNGLAAIGANGEKRWGSREGTGCSRLSAAALCSPRFAVSVMCLFSMTNISGSLLVVLMPSACFDGLEAFVCNAAGAVRPASVSSDSQGELRGTTLPVDKDAAWI